MSCSNSATYRRGSTVDLVVQGSLTGTVSSISSISAMDFAASCNCVLVTLKSRVSVVGVGLALGVAAFKDERLVGGASAIAELLLVCSVVEPLSLSELQAAVGGYIEAVALDGDPWRIMWVNEEGKIEDLPLNEAATNIRPVRAAHLR